VWHLQLTDQGLIKGVKVGATRALASGLTQNKDCPCGQSLFRYWVSTTIFV